MRGDGNTGRFRRAAAAWTTIATVVVVCVGMVFRGIGARDSRERRTSRDLLFALERRDRAAALRALAAGADPNARQRTARPPHEDWTDSLRTLLRISPNGSRYGGRDGEPTALMRAVETGNGALTGALLKRGADPNARAFYGKTVLMAACDAFASDPAGQARVVERLLKAGARVNDRATNGQSALMLAIQHTEGARVARALLAAGADADSVDIYGTTPLLYAAGVGNDAAARLLLAVGANVHGADVRGETALMCARRQGHDAVAALLKRAGARR